MSNTSTEIYSVIEVSPDAIYLSLQFIVDLIRHYLLSVVILAGIAANIVSIVIFVRCRHKDSASVVYLTMLSVSDCGNLVVYTIFYWIDDGLKAITGDRWYFAIRGNSHMGCKLLRFVLDMCRFLSAWIIVAFSIERCIAVWFPLHVVRWLTKRRRAITCCTLVATAGISNLPTLTHFGIITRYFGTDTEITCFFDTRGMSKLTKTFLFFGNITVKNYLAPCIAIVALNVIIIAGIMNTRRSKILQQRSGNQDMRATVNLLIVSTIYFILNIPYVIIWSGLEFAVFPYSARRYLYSIGHFTTSLTVLNYCTNFVIYCKSLDYYRQEVKLLLSYCCKKEKDMGKPSKVLTDNSNGTNSSS